MSRETEKLLIGSEHDKAEPSGENNIMVVFVLMLSSMIGSGLYAQPYCFLICGVGLTLVLYLFIGLVNWLGIKLLIRSGEKVGHLEYSELGFALMGPIGKAAVEFGIVLANFGFYITYIILLGTLSSSVLENLMSPSVYITPVSCAVVEMVLLIPLCLSRKFSSLHSAATVALTCIFATILFVVISPDELLTTSVSTY